MKMKRELTKEDGIKIREYRKKIQDKRTDRRMLAVQQRSEGKRNKDIAEILGVDPRIVSQWVRMYLDGGIEGLLPKKKSGRPPKLTYEQEEAILNEFKNKAEAGQMIEVSEIKTTYEKAAGKIKVTVKSTVFSIVMDGERSSLEAGIRKRHHRRRLKPQKY